MTISIFTPTHNASFLDEVYASLLAQTSADWQWVVLFNGGIDVPQFFGNQIAADPRVIIRHAPEGMDFIGALKREAVSHCTGDVLLELDHDDLLLPTAIEEVARAFEARPDAGFVYSNWIQCTGDFRRTERYSTGYGWQYRETEFHGNVVDEYLSFPPTPEAVSRIWYAPNHLRAFRRTVYDSVGGYDRTMRVLDDADLMCRMFIAADFVHLDKPLYVYRIHGKNSWLAHSTEIQANVMRLHHQYIMHMAHAWSVRNGLFALDLGGRFDAMAGLQTVDLCDADWIADLNGDWPFPDGSVGMVRAFDVFEHLRNPLHTMKELHRVLAPGGQAFIQVPSTDGRGAFQDPTHVSFWNENSILYYTHRSKARYIDTPVRFQAVTCFTTAMNAEQVCWVQAHLVKLQDGRRICGTVNI